MPEPIPIEMPPGFLRPLARDTAARLKGCYSVRAEPDRRNRPTSEWMDTPIALPDNGEVNPALFLYKFCPDVGTLKKNKSAFLASWKAIADGRPTGFAEALLSRREALLRDLSTPHARLQGKVAWRLIVGLGNPNPLETSLTLQPQYGIPLIPGSAVKGLTRHGRLRQIGAEIGVFPLPDTECKKRESMNQLTPMQRLAQLLTTPPEAAADASWITYFQQMQDDPFVLQWIKEGSPGRPLTEMALHQLLAEYGSTFQRVFGTQGQQGQVTFWDALPFPNWSYEVDVITPHYREYFQGSASPSDWLEPNPIFFLTIKEGSQFQFDLSGPDQTLADTAKDWLKRALSEFGTGSKTSSGYGEISETKGDIR